MLSHKQIGEILHSSGLTEEQKEERLMSLVLERETALKAGELVFAALLLSNTSANINPVAAQQKIMTLLAQAKGQTELRQSGRLLVNQLVESMLKA